MVSEGHLVAALQGKRAADIRAMQQKTNEKLVIELKSKNTLPRSAFINKGTHRRDLYAEYHVPSHRTVMYDLGPSSELIALK